MAEGTSRVDLATGPAPEVPTSHQCWLVYQPSSSATTPRSWNNVQRRGAPSHTAAFGKAIHKVQIAFANVLKPTHRRLAIIVKLAGSEPVRLFVVNCSLLYNRHNHTCMDLHIRRRQYFPKRADTPTYVRAVSPENDSGIVPASLHDDNSTFLRKSGNPSVNVKFTFEWHLPPRFILLLSTQTTPSPKDVHDRSRGLGSTKAGYAGPAARVGRGHPARRTRASPARGIRRRKEVNWHTIDHAHTIDKNTHARATATQALSRPSRTRYNPAPTKHGPLRHITPAVRTGNARDTV